MLDHDRVLHWEAHRPRGKDGAEIHSGFRTWLRATLASWSPDYVAIEEPLPTNQQRTELVVSKDAFGSSVQKIKKPMSSMATFRRLYGLAEAAESICFDLNIPFVEVNNQEWRQACHGVRKAPKGTTNASEWWKHQALERCRLMKIECTSKDAAEAICIAQWLGGHLRVNQCVRPDELFAERVAS